MASQASKWREEQILIICPGSQTTMAQLGCGELTPPAFRIPTRMFRDDETGRWRPYRTEKRPKKKPSGAAEGDSTGGHDENKADDNEWEYAEDPDSAEGAAYPLKGGYIANMEAFLAFLEHVHGLLVTTYHNTPIMLMAAPQWTRPDCETIAQYMFEKTKTPALCLIHSGIATQYGLKWPHMTVIDVGFQKVDITCLYDSRVVSHVEVGPHALGDKSVSGGDVFTRRLLSLLGDKGFDYDMAEQLKRSPICEVLPYAPDKPELMELPTEAAATAAAQPPEEPNDRPNTQQRQARTAAEDGEGLNGEGKGGDDGVLDVANIVVSGQTREFLAKREKEKADKAKAGKRAKEKEGADAASAKAGRLPNSKRTRNQFHYEEVVEEEVVPQPAPPAAEKAAEPEGAEMTEASTQQQQAPVDKAAKSSGGDAGANGEPAQQPPPPQQRSEEKAADKDEASAPGVAAAPAPAPAPAPSAAEPAVPERRNRRVRRDVEVGLERFLFADRGEIDRITTAIYRAVQAVEEMHMRPACWENLVFVGNGARLRGLRDNILQTLNSRHLVSPSSATMFTSELPSNLGTPSGTGSQTPTSSLAGGAPAHQLPTTSSVNPLLQAATTAGLGTPGQGAQGGGGEGGQAHHFHSQTPTAIRLAQPPTYLSEWAKNGFEEAMFLGAQVAARLAFCVHNLDAQGLEYQRMMSLSRVDYNELGPKGIRSHSMLR